MTQYGFQWPARMDCNELPVYGDPDHLCMDSKEGKYDQVEILVDSNCLF